MIGALLAAESGQHETHLETIASAAVAACLYWLAHGYANVLGGRLARQEPLSAATLMRALGREWALIRGAAIPLVALILAWALGADQEAAVTAALWSAIGSLIALELIAALRSRATRAEFVLELGVGLTMGLAILSLKIILH